MPIFFDRIDSAPLNSEKFSFEFNSWVAILVDVINENLNDIQNLINLYGGQQYTAVEISDLLAAGTLADGIFLYDTTNNVYVGMQSGALVQFTTAAYP